MAERSIYFAETIADAAYRMGDPAIGGGGDFIVVEDLDGQTVLFEYDTTNNRFVQRARLDMDGNNIENVGAFDAQSAQVGDAPTDATDVARKAEVDGKASNPLSETLDADGNDVTNVRVLDAGDATVKNTLKIGPTQYDAIAITLDEDEAKSVDVTGDTVIEVMSGGAVSGNVGIFVGVFDDIITAAQHGMTNEGNQDLGSTQGTDGALNISRDGNTLWLENRTGNGTNTWELGIRSGE